MCITCPPSNLPSAFVCAGNTTSAISDAEALTGLAFNSHPSTRRLFSRLLAFITLLQPGLLGRPLLPTYNTQDGHGRTKQNPPPKIGRIPCAEPQRRLYALWHRTRMPARKRPCRRRSPLQSIIGSESRLRSGLSDVRANSRSTRPWRGSQSPVAERNQRCRSAR